MPALTYLCPTSQLGIRAAPSLVCSGGNRKSQLGIRAAPSLFCSGDNIKFPGVWPNGKRSFAGNVSLQIKSPSFKTCATADVSGGNNAARQRAQSSRDPAKSSDNINGPDSKPATWLEVLTPLVVARAGFLVLLLVALLKLAWAVLFNTLFHPRVILYATWFLAIWPWPTAVALGLWSLAIAIKAREKRAAVWEQAVLVGGALTWLILVPCGHFQGYVDGWPLVLYGFYAVFCALHSLIRLRLYETVHTPDTAQWEDRTSQAAKITFALAISSAHWLAAQEAIRMEASMPVSNFIALFLLLASCLGTWEAKYFLGKYCDHLVVPRQVVSYGPYRWVRHPMYSWQVVLWAGYCCALRSYKSLALVLVASYAFFQHVTQKEEEVLKEAFGESYEEYKGRVTNKFVPYLF